MEIPALLREFGTVDYALLIVLDPLAVLPLIIVLNSGGSSSETFRLTLRIVTGATVLLLFFTITGIWLLRLFGVTLADLRIGGGLLLLVIALRLVIEGHIVPEGGQGYKAAIVPIISPLLIGPGAITASVVLAAIHGVWFTALAGIVAMLISFLMLLSARIVYRLIGESGTDLISRIMGVLIAAIAVSYIRSGFVELLK